MSYSRDPGQFGRRVHADSRVTPPSVVSVTVLIFFGSDRDRLLAGQPLRTRRTGSRRAQRLQPASQDGLAAGRVGGSAPKIPVNIKLLILVIGATVLVHLHRPARAAKRGGSAPVIEIAIADGHHHRGAWSQIGLEHRRRTSGQCTDLPHHRPERRWPAASRTWVASAGRAAIRDVAGRRAVVEYIAQFALLPRQLCHRRGLSPPA